MNPEVLSTLSGSVDKTIEAYGNRFEAVVKADTTSLNVNESSIALANEILNRLEGFLNPEILVVPRRALEALQLNHGGAFTEQAQKELLECIARHGRYMRRAEAEATTDQVQIIACGVLVHDDRVFIFERKERDPKYRLYGKNTIWQGTH